MKREKKFVVPKFKSESEEAAWWFENRALVEEALINAMDRKTIRRAPARNITIRMQEADLALARRQAQRSGLPYQTYIKSVLHEALVHRERSTR
jgi:predicted DNA binding CopG/RHH family protein